MTCAQRTARSNILDQCSSVTIKKSSNLRDFALGFGEQVLETNPKISLCAEMESQHLRTEIS
jgi:hypothetical protein